jgi:hypothetical protein
MNSKKNRKEYVKKQAGVNNSFNSWLIAALLSVIVLVVYFPSFSNGLTELDDTIFMNENKEYNKDISNLGTSFNRGVFGKEDSYYRPMLLNSYILNFQVSKDDVKGYHICNILLHLLSVILLWRLLLKLKLSDRAALFLTILFAVHPALSQAVSWIPGRNDTLLASFTFGFIITAINYLEGRKWISLVSAFLLLLAALFTKESALFIPFGTIFILGMIGIIQWKDKRNLLIYFSWLLAILLFFVIKSKAGLNSNGFTISVMADNFLSRIPALIQYFGKTILPFNLSVFPILQDTSNIYGLLAILLLGALIYYSGKSNKRIIIAGFGWFLLMLLPVILLPTSLNDQDFEHRLYVPFLGILLILSQTLLFTRLTSRTSSFVCIGVAIIFAGININHQKKFSNPISFWESAVESSPHSSYATMMLACRVDVVDLKRANELMIKAYSLNPKEKYINFYVGKMYNDKGESEIAEKYLLQELNISSYYETYFQLSRIEFLKKNLDKSISYMETYLQKAPHDQSAITNYILMLIDNGQKQKAYNYILQKQKEGIILPKELIDKAVH